MKIHKLTPAIGAEISGVDLSQPLTPTTVLDLKNALIDNRMIFFRDQKIEPEYLPKVITQFGEMYIHPWEKKYNNNPEIGYVFSGEHTTFTDVDGKFMHSDRTAAAEPPRTSMLYITECPPVGGDTIFVNTSKVYNQMDDGQKSFLSSLSSLHVAPGKNRDSGDYTVGATHPVIATRPETQEKYLNVNEMASVSITRLKSMESNSLLSRLFHTLRHPQYSCRLRWSPNTVAWWDNFGSQHQAIWDYYPARRVGYRVLSKNLY
jgi:taurine dioxygenase